MKLSRREMLQATAAAMALPLVKGDAAKPKFFTPAEFAVVDELSDMIIPADAQSGGARAAGVAAYIDARLAESFDPPSPDGREPVPSGAREGQGVRTEWRAGLKAVEALSREMHGKGFMEATPAQRLALLTRIAAAESDAKTPAERFFKEIKGATIRAYYTSKVGIHDDQRYKGNVYQTGEYAGSDPT